MRFVFDINKTPSDKPALNPTSLVGKPIIFTIKSAILDEKSTGSTTLHLSLMADVMDYPILLFINLIKNDGGINEVGHNTLNGIIHVTNINDAIESEQIRPLKWDKDSRTFVEDTEMRECFTSLHEKRIGLILGHDYQENEHGIKEDIIYASRNVHTSFNADTLQTSSQMKAGEEGTMVYLENRGKGALLIAKNKFAAIVKNRPYLLGRDDNIAHARALSFTDEEISSLSNAKGGFNTPAPAVNTTYPRGPGVGAKPNSAPTPPAKTQTAEDDDIPF